MVLFCIIGPRGLIFYDLTEVCLSPKSLNAHFLMHFNKLNSELSGNIGSFLVPLL